MMLPLAAVWLLIGFSSSVVAGDPTSSASRAIQSATNKLMMLFDTAVDQAILFPDPKPPTSIPVDGARYASVSAESDVAKPLYERLYDPSLASYLGRRLMLTGDEKMIKSALQTLEIIAPGNDVAAFLFGFLLGEISRLNMFLGSEFEQMAQRYRKLAAVANLFCDTVPSDVIPAELVEIGDLLTVEPKPSDEEVKVSNRLMDGLRNSLSMMTGVNSEEMGALFQHLCQNVDGLPDPFQDIFGALLNRAAPEPTPTAGSDSAFYPHFQLSGFVGRHVMDNFVRYRHSPGLLLTMLRLGARFTFEDAVRSSLDDSEVRDLLPYLSEMQSGMEERFADLFDRERYQTIRTVFDYPTFRYEFANRIEFKFLNREFDRALKSRYSDDIVYLATLPGKEQWLYSSVLKSKVDEALTKGQFENALTLATLPGSEDWLTEEQAVVILENVDEDLSGCRTLRDLFDIEPSTV